MLLLVLGRLTLQAAIFMPRLLFPLLVCVASLGPFQAVAAERLQIYVSVPPQRFLVERIGGDRVSVHVMLAAGQTPETFDPSLRQLERLAGSRLYFLSGVPFENHWLVSLRRMHPEVRFIPCCEAVLEEYGGDPDPHVWTSPENAKRLALNIYRVLAEEDPDAGKLYSANRDRLLEEMDGLDAYIRQTLADRRTDFFITAHAAWGHFARAYGLREVALERRGREIGPKGMAELMSLARRENIHTVFAQEQYRTPLVETLAARLDAGVEVLNPLAEDYTNNMKRVTERIAGALK